MFRTLIVIVGAAPFVLFSPLAHAEGQTGGKPHFSCDVIGLHITLPPKFSIWPVAKAPYCVDRTSKRPPNPSLGAAPSARTSVMIKTTRKDALTESVHVDVSPGRAGASLLGAMQARLKQTQKLYETVKVLKPPSKTKFFGHDASSMTVNIIPMSAGFHSSDYITREVMLYTRGVTISLAHRYDRDKKPIMRLQDIVRIEGNQ